MDEEIKRLENMIAILTKTNYEIADKLHFVAEKLEKSYWEVLKEAKKE